MLAAVFHGLGARRISGAVTLGEDLATFVDNLRGLADAVSAFDQYRPGTFVDEQPVERIAAERRQEAEQ